MQKPSRKNSHKERIFSLLQNPLKSHEPFLLTANKARESLKRINGWQLTDDHKTIYREFIVQDFMVAIDLIDRIAVIAEAEKHHPDIHLTQYRNLRVCLTSHDLGGLSEKDLTVAAEINSLPIPDKAMALNQQLQNKNKDPRKPRYEQKNDQPKARKIVAPTLKKASKSSKPHKAGRMSHK